MTTRIFLLPLFVSVVACSSDEEPKTALRAITGSVFKGPVANGYVSIRAPGSSKVFAETTTQEDGSFTLELERHHELLEVCATGGAYRDEVTGVIVALGSKVFCAMREAPASLDEVNVVVSPMSHLHAMRARGLLRTGKEPTWANAIASATTDVEEYLACGDPDFSVLNILPVLPSEENIAAVDNNAALFAGLLVYGFSKQAEQLGAWAGKTAGIGITAISLIDAYGLDLQFDGIVDGRAGQDISVEGIQIGPSLLRDGGFNLASMIEQYLMSEENRSQITPSDIEQPLRCMTTSQSNWFRVDGRIPDTAGPEITVRSIPNEVEGKVELVFTARDAESTASDAWFDGGPALLSQATTLNGDRLRVAAMIDTARLPDGKHSVLAKAQDQHGNISLKNIQLNVNNAGPSIEFAGDIAEPLSGTVTLTFRAVDGGEITRLEAEGFAVSDTDTLTFDLDTAQALGGRDGDIALELSSTDAAGNITEKVFEFEADNFVDTEVTLLPYLGTPVNKLNYEIFQYGPNGKGERLAAGSSNNGSARALLPDTHTGDLFISMSALGANFLDAFGNEITFSSNDRLLAIVPYRPSTLDGEPIVYAVDAMSTIAAEVQTGLYAEGLVATNAAALVQSHMFRPSNDTLSGVVAMDLLSPEPGANELSQRKALAHAGLSQLGANWAEADGLAPGAISILKVLSLISQDARDGTLDGRNVNNGRIRISPSNHLSAEAFRRELVSATASYLQAPTNETGLALSNVSHPLGFLEILATTDNGLFELPSGQPLQPVGPAISVSQVPALIEESTYFNVDAHSSQGVARVGLSVDGVELSSVIGPVANFEIDPTLYTTGTHVVTFWAEDYNGIRTSETHFVQSISSQPELSVRVSTGFGPDLFYDGIDGHIYDLKDPRSFHLAITATPALVAPSSAYHVSVTVGDVELPTPTLGNAFGGNIAFVSNRIGVCGEAIPVSVQLSTSNTTQTLEFSVRCPVADDVDIQVISGGYIPATDIGFVGPDDPAFQPGSHEPVSLDDSLIVDIRTCSFSADEPCPISLFAPYHKQNSGFRPIYHLKNELVLELDFGDFDGPTSIRHEHSGVTSKPLNISSSGSSVVNLDQLRSLDGQTQLMRQQGRHKVIAQRSLGGGVIAERELAFDVTTTIPPIIVSCEDSLGRSQEDLRRFFSTQEQVSDITLSTPTNFGVKFIPPSTTVSMAETGRYRIASLQKPSGTYAPPFFFDEYEDELGRWYFWEHPLSSDWADASVSPSCTQFNFYESDAVFQRYTNGPFGDEVVDTFCPEGMAPGIPGDPLYPYNPWEVNITLDGTRPVWPRETREFFTDDAPSPISTHSREPWPVLVRSGEATDGLAAGDHMGMRWERGLIHRDIVTSFSTSSGTHTAHRFGYAEYEFTTVIDSLEIEVVTTVPNQHVGTTPVPIVYSEQCARSWNTNY